MHPEERYTIGVLCYLNILNYMDRFAVVGVLTEIQLFFKVGDHFIGLLHSGFIMTFMICAPVFGYMGDRCSRRLILLPSLAAWMLAAFCASFSQRYCWFFVLRSLVGVGEAAFCTLAPTIISDVCLFKERPKMLALFYLGMPVGSGLGYIVGAKAAEISGEWWWALRVTPLLGGIGLLLLYFTIEPQPGQKEGLQAGPSDGRPAVTQPPLHCHFDGGSSYWRDVRCLVKNRTYSFSTLGFTCVSFSVGAVGWWGPKLLLFGFSRIPGETDITFKEVAYPCGVMTICTGLLGVSLGSMLSHYFRPKYSRTDPIICGTGLLISIPAVIGLLLMSSVNVLGTFVFVFIGQVALNVNWAVVIDILLYVVIPTRRATATSLQIFVSHALGDAISPFLIGLLSEYIKVELSSEGENGGGGRQRERQTNDSMNYDEFRSIQLSLFSVVIVQIIGVFFFILTALFVVGDWEKASRATAAPRL